MSQFAQLNLHPVLLSAIEKIGYTNPSEVQQKVIPIAMGGQDVMVSSQTGSGKTAAFLLPVLHRIMTEEGSSDTSVPKAQGKQRRGGRRPEMMPKPKAIVMCPTRELAQQVSKEAIALKGDQRNVRIATVVGGMPYGRQIKELQNVTILVATPGRLLDLHKQNAISFDDVKFFIADEADRMLDLGFAEDIEKLHRDCRNNEQTLMFSATFPPKVMHLAEKMMNHPVRVELSLEQNINKNIHQVLHWADGREHQKKLLMHWLESTDIDQAVIFTSTQIESEEIARELKDQEISADFLHGGLQQRVRNRCLDNLRRGRIKFLVATDVAARGIDVSTITHVFNYGVPMKPEDYVHRIGRTGRAGREGTAVTFINHREKRRLDDIERYTDSVIEATVVEGLEPRKKPERSSNNSKGRGGRKRSASGAGAARSEGRGRRTRDERPRSADDRRSRDEAPRKNGRADHSATPRVDRTDRSTAPRIKRESKPRSDKSRNASRQKRAS